MHIRAISSVLALVLLASMPADSAGPIEMVIVKGRDIEGEVFKRLGLPNQDYCWQQCLQEDRCSGARWGVIEGMVAGQCQLMSGELTLRDLADLKTSDGQRIRVTASRKEASAPSGARSGT